MKKFLLITLLFFTSASFAQPPVIRGLYVNGFNSILGNTLLEDSLLNYARNGNFNYLALYNVWQVHQTYDLTTVSTSAVFANFIKKAKLYYNIRQVGAIGENFPFFSVINIYNQLHTDTLEKLDVYNVEFEFWATTTVSPGGYYCTTYLSPASYSCDSAGAFAYYRVLLHKVDSLAHTAGVMSETYIGRFNAGQGAIVANSVDRILLSDYTNDSSVVYEDLITRLRYIASAHVITDVIPIFSAEPEFMGSWLSRHPVSQPYHDILPAFTADTGAWKSYINFVGYQWFTYSYMHPIPPLSASSSSGTIACFGGSTVVTVTATGGTAPYTGTGTFTRSAGTYTFAVTDINGTTSNTAITIAQPPLLNASSTSGMIACFGGSTVVTVTATGGTTPYTGTGTFTRPAGTHTFTVTDGNSCASNSVITIAQPALLTGSSASGMVPCFGGSATLTVTATGGTTPYTGAGTFTRPAGTYTFTVTDNNSCTSNTAITITEPALLTASSASGAIACFGGTTVVTVTATGGTTPYTGAGTFTRSAGTYTFTVTDANSCTSNTVVTITEPTQLTASSASGRIGCFGGSTVATVTATGGTTPYTGTGTFTRPAGTSTFTVTDGNGCIANSVTTITEPELLMASSRGGMTACFGGSMVLTVTATGGTTPYTGTGTFTRPAGTYSFTVTDSNSCTSRTVVTITEPALLTASSASGATACFGGSAVMTVTATGGTTPYTGAGIFTRPAGTYTFTVTDSNSCASNTIINITEPTQLIASSASGTIACFGGSTAVTVTAMGGTTPYTATGTYTIPAGTHTFTVTDGNGCTSNTVINITEPTQLTASSTSGTIGCFGGSTEVTVTASGGTAPYIGTNTYAMLAGTYIFTVTDSNSCTSNSAMTITEPAVLIAASTSGTITSPGGTTVVTVTATGGSAPYTDTGTFIRPAGTYTFTVTDSNGCSSSTVIIITEHITTTVSNGQQTNSDIVIFPNPASGEIKICVPENEEIQSVKIINPQGQIVYFQQHKSSSLTIDLNLPVGVYFCLIGINGTEINKKIVAAR